MKDEASYVCDACGEEIVVTLVYADRVRTVIGFAKGSRFLLCELSKTNLAFPKYPPQPVVRCQGFTQKKAVTDEEEA